MLGALAPRCEDARSDPASSWREDEAAAAHFTVAQALAEELVRTIPDAALAAASMEGVHEVLFEAEPSHIPARADSAGAVVDFKEASKRAPRPARTRSPIDWILRVGMRSSRSRSLSTTSIGSMVRRER